MKHICKKSLSLLLVLCMLVSLFAGLSITVGADGETQLTFTKEAAEITAGGTYTLASGAAGTITVSTTEKVTLVGGYALKSDLTEETTSYKFSALSIDCSGTPGAQIELKNMGISGPVSEKDCINFSGTGNVLTITGTNLIDFNPGYVSQSAIHVGTGTALTINGTGTLYLYKSAAGAGFGGNSGELNGDIIFGDADSDTLQVFAKGTKQSALIGAGASANADNPGSVSFVNGTYNLMTNSRGACIGGSAGSTGASGGTTVYISGNASVNINVDFSGAAVGGGGYDAGNDSSGGTLYISGGSLRTFVDKNAENGTKTGYQGAAMTLGINDAAITAARKNNSTDNKNVYKCVFDTSKLTTAATSFEVKVDGVTYYQGGLHGYKYLNETVEKESQTVPASTPLNWIASTDPNLYLYLTGENHTLTVNGESFTATYDSSITDANTLCTSGPFTVAADTSGGGDSYDWTSTKWAGGLDFSWYNENDVKSEYHITTPAQWEALAWICSEHLSDLADYTTKTNGNVTAIKGTIPTAQNTFAGVQFYLDNDIDMGGVCTSGVWSGKNYYPIGSQGANDAGNANWYGLFYGSFNGQGYTVKNVFCNRGAGKSYQSVGLFGRVGAADDPNSQGQAPANAPQFSIVIENIAVTGYIKSGRSVGGIVGKTLHVGTGNTVTVRNCINFAKVESTDSKGVGGVVGALWNKTSLSNCVNFGTVNGAYKDACTGGIVGTNDNVNYVSNSYNVGDITNSASGAYAGAICGANNQAAKMLNCYYLADSLKVTGSGITVYGTSKNAAEMKSTDFAALLSGDGRGWVIPATDSAIYALMSEYGVAGYPVPRTFTMDTATVSTVTTEGTPAQTYYTGHSFEAGSFKVWANYSDSTRESVTDYTLKLGGTVISSDYKFTSEDNGKTLTVSGTYAGKEYSAGPFTLTVNVNVPAEITGTNGMPTNLIYAVGETIAAPTSASISVRYADGTTKAVLSSSDSTYFLNITTAAAKDDGAKLYVKYTELGTTVEKELGTLKIVAAVPETAGVYQISAADQLAWFSAYVGDAARGNGSGKAVLLNDIDTTAAAWTPISFGTTGFVGSFDGQGHSVKININASNATNQGFFGIVGTNGSVKNITVEGSVSGGQKTGGVIGSVVGAATIEGCINKATVTGSSTYVGGVIGGATGSSAKVIVKNCANCGTVKSTATTGQYVGGIVGQEAASTSEIAGCHNTGTVSGAYNVGGIVGHNKAKVTNCYNCGSVTASAGTTSSGVGGIAGMNVAVQTYANCYNSGTITGSNGTIKVGAIVGYSSFNITLNDCYYLDGSAAEACNIGSGKTKTVNNVAAKTDAEMKASAFVTLLNGESGTAWKASYGEYPVLSWQTAKTAPTPSTTPSVAVILNGTTVKTYTGAELDTLAAGHNGTLYFSGIGGGKRTINDARTLAAAKRYVTVEELLNGAITGYSDAAYADYDIVFTATDNHTTTMTVGSLLGTTRYYYPAWLTAETYTDDITGAVAANAAAVPAVLTLSGYTATSDDNGLDTINETTNTLKGCFAAPSKLDAVCDGTKAPRLLLGQKSGGDSTEKNLGGLSGTNIVSIELKTPVSHSISKAACTNGSFSVSAASALHDETITVTTTPDSGYAVESVLAGTKAAVKTQGKENEYTFTMPDADVTVTVTFAQSTAASADVTWYNAADTSFTLSDAADLLGLAAIVNGGNDLSGKTVTLANDISLSGVTFTPIGTADHPFAGTFNGTGKEITGLTVSSAAGYTGLFGYNKGTIENLSLSGTVTAAGTVDFVGSVAGYNGGIITSVTSSVTVSAENAYNVGGIVGFNDGGIRANPTGDRTNEKVITGNNAFITESAYTGSVTGNTKVGGIAGENSGTVQYCYCSGTVDGTNAGSKNGVGGIVGRNGNNNTAYETGVIDSCCFTGSVGRDGQKWVGGIAGFNSGTYGNASATPSTVKNCYMAGSFRNGDNKSNAITNPDDAAATAKCTNNYALEGYTNSGNSEAEVGIVKTAAYMKSAAFVKDLNGEAGTAWKESCSSYPVLFWQTAAAHSYEEGVCTACGAEDPGYVKTVEVTPTVNNGKATAEISNPTVEANKPIAFDATSSDDTVTESVVSIPKTAMDTVKTAEQVTIKSNAASLSMDQELLNHLSGAAGEKTISISVAAKTAEDIQDVDSADTAGAVIIEVKITAGSDSITAFGGNKLKLTIPAAAGHMVGKEYKVIELSADGSRKTLSGLCEMQGSDKVLVVETEGLSFFVGTTNELKPYSIALSVDSTKKVGDDVVVTLAVTNSDTNITSFNSYDLTLTYDSAKLTYKSSSLTADASAAGTLILRGCGDNKSCSDGITVTFTAKAEGAATVTLTSAKMDMASNANQAAAAAAITTAADSCTISPASAVNVATKTDYLAGYTLIAASIANPDGNVPTYDGKAMFKVTNVGDHTTYAADKYYYIVKTADYVADKIGLAAKTAASIAKNGDVNGEGGAEINDAQFVYNLYNSFTGSYTPTAKQLLAADVNGDGVININDCVAAIAKIPGN